MDLLDLSKLKKSRLRVMLENETHWGPFQYHCKKFTLILTLLTNNWLYGLIFGPQTNILQKKKKMAQDKICL